MGIHVGLDWLEFTVLTVWRNATAFMRQRLVQNERAEWHHHQRLWEEELERVATDLEVAETASRSLRGELEEQRAQLRDQRAQCEKSGLELVRAQQRSAELSKEIEDLRGYVPKVEALQQEYSELQVSFESLRDRGGPVRKEQGAQEERARTPNSKREQSDRKMAADAKQIRPIVQELQGKFAEVCEAVKARDFGDDVLEIMRALGIPTILARLGGHAKSELCEGQWYPKKVPQLESLREALHDHGGTVPERAAQHQPEGTEPASKSARPGQTPPQPLRSTSSLPALRPLTPAPRAPNPPDSAALMSVRGRGFAGGNPGTGSAAGCNSTMRRTPPPIALTGLPPAPPSGTVAGTAATARLPLGPAQRALSSACVSAALPLQPATARRPTRPRESGGPR